MLHQNRSRILAFAAASAVTVLGVYAYYLLHIWSIPPQGSLTISPQGGAFYQQSRVGTLRLEHDRAVLRLPLVYPESGLQSGQLSVTLPSSVTYSQQPLSVESLAGTAGIFLRRLSASSFQISFPDHISKDASLVLVIQLNPDQVQLPWSMPLLTGLQENVQWAWAGAGLLIVLAASIYTLHWRYPRLPKSNEYLPGVPFAMSPTEMGILLEGRLRPNHFFAAFYGLLLKRAITIISSGSQTMVFRLSEPAALNASEQAVLDLILPKGFLRSEFTDLIAGLQRGPFSEAVSVIYEEAYADATKLRWFEENPALFHLRQKSVAILLQLGAVLFLIYGMLLGLRPLGNGVFLFGLCLYLAGTIIWYRDRVSSGNLTATGKSAVEQVAQFRAFLASESPLYDARKSLFYDYYGYAAVLGVVPQWRKRFGSGHFYVPDWLSSEQQSVISPDQFVILAAELLGELTHLFDRLKDPNVD